MATYTPTSLSITGTNTITWTDTNYTFVSTLVYDLLLASNIGLIRIDRNQSGNNTNSITFSNFSIPSDDVTVGNSYPLSVGDGDGTIYYTVASIDATITCFVKGTNILILRNDIEQYVKIENLKIDDLIKTYKNGYKKLKYINYKQFKNDNSVFQICKLSNLENQTEDLFLTGAHSLLVDNLNDNQTKEILKYRQIENCKIEDKYLLMTFCHELSEKINNNDIYELYHLVLENDDEYGQYGIYSNGILSESMSLNCYKSLLRTITIN